MKSIQCFSASCVTSLLCVLILNLVAMPFSVLHLLFWMRGGEILPNDWSQIFFPSLFSSSSSTKISFILSALLCLSFYPPISASLLLFGQLYNNVWSRNHHRGAPLARAPCTEGCSGMGLSTPQANLLCYIPHLSPPLYFFFFFSLSQNKIFRLNITLFVKLKALWLFISECFFSLKDKVV